MPLCERSQRIGKNNGRSRGWQKRKRDWVGKGRKISRLYQTGEKAVDISGERKPGQRAITRTILMRLSGAIGKNSSLLREESLIRETKK